jgi:hypothetical protein
MGLMLLIFGEEMFGMSDSSFIGADYGSAAFLS